MVTTVTSTSAPTFRQDVQRLEALADKAMREGVRILRTLDSGEAFALSTSQPNRLYRLTAHSCQCKGFLYYGRCKHHALLLRQLGFLGTLPAEEDTATVTVSVEVHTSGGVYGFDHEWVPRTTTLHVDGMPRVRVEEDVTGVMSWYLSERYADTDVSGDVPSGVYTFRDVVAYWTKELHRLETEHQTWKAMQRLDLDHDHDPLDFAAD